MDTSADMDNYAQKMLSLVERGVDFEVDARFVDALLPRQARVLDIGCGIGNAVAALRSRGHQAFGIDPTPALFEAATSLHDASWFRQIGAGAIYSPEFSAAELPGHFDAILASGNVPEFLTNDELELVFKFSRKVLTPLGALIIGTSTHGRHGPRCLDQVAEREGLKLQQRFGDWHLNPFNDQSPWSVSIYTINDLRGPFEGPDGIFVLANNHV